MDSMRRARMRGSFCIAIANGPKVEATDISEGSDAREIGGRGRSPTRRAYWLSCFAISIILADAPGSRRRSAFMPSEYCSVNRAQFEKSLPRTAGCGCM